nr:hypothetical protein [Tanacetum cinerariifolium]
MQQKVERLQAQLRDLKGKSSDTPSASNTLDPLNQKLESKIIELEFQVINYEREISHLRTTYKNLFDSITSNQAHAKLHDLIYENAQLRARVFENTSESMNNTSGISVTPHVDKPKLSVVTPHSKKLHASISSHSVPQPREFNENVSSDTGTASSTGLVHTARTRRPQPKGNTRNARVPSASKSSGVKKNVTIEDHCRTLLLFKNQKTMSSECNNIKLTIRNDKSKIIYGTCKQCLVTANHDTCLLSSVNALNSRANNLCANVPPSANQKRHRTQKFLGTVRFGNDHIAAILGYGDLKWGNITITRVYFVKGGTLASLEIWMVLTCSKAIILQISTPSISMTWPQLLPYVSWPVQLQLNRGYDINDYPTSTSTPSTTLPRMISSSVYQSLNMLKNIFVPLVRKEKSKRASYPPKPVLNSKQRLHLLHMDLCGPIKPDISYLHVFGALCYPKNDREDIGKLGAKGDIGFFIGYSANSVAYRIFAPAPTNSLDTPVSSHNVDGTSHQHDQQQRNLTPSPTASAADNVPNVVFEGDFVVNPFATPSTDIMKPKTIKEALTDPAWIESIQEELHQFIRLDVNQSLSGIFIKQSNYVNKILKKYRLNTCDIVGTPMDIKYKLDLEQIGTPVDATKYRSMIGALMYLTSSKSNIVHATCVCARYQAHPTENHLKEVKRIFRYLRGILNMGLWYTKDGFELTGFLDADYARCKDTFKSTFGGA